jgi:transposase
MLAVGLVHRECRYQSKMATQVEKATYVIWFVQTHSASTVQRLLCIIIYAWRKQLQETGYLCKGKSPGRPRVADDTVESVRRSYMISSSKLTNCASRELDIPQPTVWKILRKRLKTMPYKIQLLQAPVSQLTGAQRTERGKSFCTAWT